MISSYSNIQGEMLSARMRANAQTQHGSSAAAVAAKMQGGQAKSLEQATADLQSAAQTKGKDFKGQLDAATYNAKLKEACDGFEELFVHKMLQVMRESSTKNEHLLHGGRGEEIFQDMLDENYSKEFSKTGQLGLSRMIYDATKMETNKKV